MAAAWAPPAGDADWSPPAGDADAVPAAPAASAGASDYANPTAAAEPDSADPATLYRQYHTYGAQSPEELNEFMRRYKEDPSSIGDARKAKTAGYVASMLTGLPRAAAGVALAVPAAVAGGAGALTGTLGALADTGLGRPDRAGEDLEAGRERLRSWSAATYGLANYVPATQAGAAYASQLLAVPSQIGSAVNQGIVKPVLGDNAAQAVGDIAQDIGTELPAFGAPGLVRAGVKGAAALGRGVRGALTTPEPAEGTTYDAAGNAVAPSRGLTPPVGQPVTGATLRASPNPIPPPEGTVAAAKQPPPVTEVGIKTSTGPTPIPDNITPPTEPAAPSAASPTQAPTQETTARPAPATRVSGPKNQRGSVRVMNSPGEESAFDAMGRIIPGASLFTSPKDEGPQETPNPAEQGERAANLDAIDKLSSGGLPSRRASAISGDYNATGDDWQLKETGSKTMQAQLASENAALHAATDNVHNSVGSEFGDSVDPTTMENRADVTRGAIQAIEKHFDGMTDELYDNARAVHGDTPMPQFLTRANSFLGDDANYMPDGFRKAAQARLQQLRTVGDAGIKGDGTDAAAPSSVGAAEKFREWLNQNRTLDNMHTTRQLVNHTDMDVAQSGGPGLFQAARNMKTYSYQMLEEPTGIRKLLAPGDSQGINHAIKRHEVMDYIANLDGPQHEHVLNVLRAGAHLTPELAESSAAAIREIQAHTVSRLHDAATDDGGKWNARGFYNAASRYGRNAASTFADRPDIVRNLKTINDAGNTLHMDRHYPGAAAQAVRSGALAAAAAVGGKALASVAHEIPLAGRMVGRAIENATEKATGEMADTAREKMATSRLVDRNGKQRGSVRVMNAPGEEGALDILGRNPVVQAAGQLAPKKEDQGVVAAARMRGDKTIPAYVPESQRGSVKVMNEPAPEEGNGSMLNVGLHQGTQGEPGFRKMSKQEAQAAVESTGAKVTKNSVLTPDRHGVFEPTAVMSTNRPLSNEEMQSVLAKTKQTAIPQRADNGDESMHVAPGHEQTAKEQGWDSFNPEYFREHDGRTMTDTAANPKNIHPDTTVTNPKRSAFPGVYDDPEEIMKRYGEVKPESPHLREIFGKTREDLHDDAVARGDVEPKTPIPGIAPKGKGSAHASDITNDANAERIRNIIQSYKEHDPSGYHGMVGWYEMDPMYQSIKKILGGSDDAASKVYHNLNSMTAYASPMSPVGTEITRGTAAAMMAAEGNFDKFAKYGNLPQKKAPAALKAKNFELGNMGTMAHGSQAPAMGRFLETGQEANAVKTGTYRRSGDAPSRQGTDYQNTVPVGDSHWSRGVGLSDVRGAAAFDGSAEGPEMKVLAPWYHDSVARHPDINLPSTSAQAVQWAALSKETGVDSPVGAPKLEIWADKIATAAKREGIAPRAMWERIVKRLAK